MARYRLTVTYDDNYGEGLEYLEEAIDQAGGFVSSTDEIDDDEESDDE